MPNTFATKVDYITSAYPFYVAVVDVNGDGKPDIVTANYDVNKTVDVLLNQGSGTFTRKVHYPIGASTRSVAVVDVNGDGKPDIVTANYDGVSTTVSVLLNQGSVTFSTKVDYPTGSGINLLVVSVAVGDVNGDSKPDIVTCSDGIVSVLLNQGNGTFATKVDYPTGVTISVSVVDVSGDGKPDIVSFNIANGQHIVSVWLNQGSGTLATKVDYPTGYGIAYSVAVVDVNGDGKPDIVTAGGSLLLNQGSGTFGIDVGYKIDVGFYNTYQSVTVVDVNGDGKPDIVLANRGAEQSAGVIFRNQCAVVVALNQGNGTFTADAVEVYDTGSAIVVAVADVNGDGKPDIVTGGFQGVSVLLGTCSIVGEAGPSCTPCPSNQYTIDHITCSPCGAGNYGGFGSSCTPCAAGYYNSLGNGTACIIAPAGTYVEGTGFTKPTPCQTGTYSAALGATSFDTCLAAPAGSFTNTKLGATNYTQCPSGYYNPGVGYGSSYADTNACKQCPAGFITSLNSTVCAPCSNTIQVNSTGLYNGTNCNDIFEITTLSNVTIDLCSGGADTIVAHSTSNPNQQIILRCFNISDDKLQLSGAQCIDDKDFNFTDC